MLFWESLYEKMSNLLINESFVSLSLIFSSSLPRRR
jgi:hypothetical protein